MIRLAFLVLANVAGSAFCSLSEAALLASSEARIRARLQGGDPRAERLLALRRDPGKTLASIVFLNNIFAIAGTAFITHQASMVIDSGWGMGAFIGLQTLLIIAFGEIVPNVLGEAHPESIAMRLSSALVVVRRLLAPLVRLMEMIVGWARPRGRIAPGQETEIRELALLGTEGGHLDPEEAELISRVFPFFDIRAQDVMTPRALVNGFQADTTLAQAREDLLNANHSQFPIYETDLDEVVGVVWLRDALSALVKDEHEKTLREFMRTPHFVPQSRTADDVLRDLQSMHRRMTIVLDEYGVTLGIITMDDLVEELVGEAIDETDVSEGLVKRISKTAVLVHGLTRVRDVVRFLDCLVAFEDPEEQTNTVSGLLQDRLGRIPVKGDVIVVTDLSLEVRKADARMAVRVFARRVPIQETSAS